MQSAGGGPFFIHVAAPCLRIQVVAVTIGAARQGEEAVLEIEVLNHPHFLQAFGNLFGRFVLGFKRVHQLEAHQVGQFDFHGHGAAVGRAAVAQAVAIAAPGVAVVHIDDGDGRPHAAFPQDSGKHVARGGI